MANTKKDAKSSGSENSKTTTQKSTDKVTDKVTDEIKKRRGRPKKTPKSAGNVVNENEKQISMSANLASSGNPVNDFNSSPNQLPQVTSSVTNLSERYTLEGI